MTAPVQLPMFFEVKQVAVVTKQIGHTGKRGGADEEKAVAGHPVDCFQVRGQFSGFDIAHRVRAESDIHACGAKAVPWQTAAAKQRRHRRSLRR